MGLLAAFAALAGTAGCGKAPAPPPVVVGHELGSPIASLQDDRLIQVPPAEAADRIRAMADLGARLIRVDLRWDRVAAAGRPADPANPADPAYDWAPYDAIVAAAGEQGMEVLFAVWGTPPWARDRSVPPSPDERGFPSVRPADPQDFGDFGAAAARRYAPRGVRRWEAWNEPNIALFLHPQYERRAGRWTAVSPATYGELLDRFYAAVKRVSPKAVVAGAVLAPAGDPCGLSCRQSKAPARVPPPAFLRALDAPGLRPRMDVVSHHPYPILLLRPDQVSVRRPNTVDIYNLETLFSAIDATYLRGRPVWLTEYGFSTEPVKAYRTFVSRDEQAGRIADAFVRMRVAWPRVQLMTYYLLQDNDDWRSGLTDRDGTPKPGRDAFAMPLAADPAGRVAPGSRVRLVGQVRPAAGRTRVEVEWRTGGGWRPLTAVATSPDGTYSLTVEPAHDLTLRARWAGTAPSGNEAKWTSPEVAIPVSSAP